MTGLERIPLSDHRQRAIGFIPKGRGQLGRALSLYHLFPYRQRVDWEKSALEAFLKNPDELPEEIPGQVHLESAGDV